MSMDEIGTVTRLIVAVIISIIVWRTPVLNFLREKLRGVLARLLPSTDHALIDEIVHHHEDYKYTQIVCGPNGEKLKPIYVDRNIATFPVRKGDLIIYGLQMRYPEKDSISTIVSVGRVYRTTKLAALTKRIHMRGYSPTGHIVQNNIPDHLNEPVSVVLTKLGSIDEHPLWVASDSGR